MEKHLPSFLDELEKIAAMGMTPVERGILALVLGKKKIEKGVRRHEETMRAVRAGYPAGWVALGMKPR